MNCQNHPDVPASAYCRSCGKPLCDDCKRPALGTVYCDEHLPAPATAVPPPPVTAGPPSPPPGASVVYCDCSPGLAFLLGVIPGVGAIYNGQYAKGLVHAVITGVLISIMEAGAGGMEPLMGMLLAAWFFYMPFEAYHTARKRRLGEPVDEFSSILKVGSSSRFPTAAVLLIALGVLLLLNTLELLSFRYVARYWPVILIAAGAYMLYGRLTGEAAREVRHERQ
jgi:hypothetical protein